MSELVRRLDEVRRGDVPVAGGKGANLGELIAAGFPVPTGFLVTAGACGRFFESIGIEAHAKRLNEAGDGAVKVICDEVAASIREAEPGADLAEAIEVAHGELRRSRGERIVCAVRSSATAEDLGDASFAGQHGT